MLEMQALAKPLRLSAQDGSQAHSIHRLRAARAGQGQQRRHHILQADRQFGAQAPLKTQFRRRGHEEWDVGRPFIRLAFPVEAVVSEHLAVVGREHDHPGPPGLSAPFLKCRHQRRNLVVQVLDQAEVARLRRPQSLALQQHAMPGLVARRRQGRPIHPIAASRGGQLLPPIGIKIPPGGKKRRVGRIK